MRTKTIAGNWKMNLTWNEAMHLLTELSNDLEPRSGVNMVLFPPVLYLRPFYEFLDHCRAAIALGAQDCSSHGGGAFTGEISASMVAAAGATHVLIGHSERRQYHHEDSGLLKMKIQRALESKLHPVVCCGETLAERESGRWQDVVELQIRACLNGIEHGVKPAVTIAYEPVWAIGTGRNATAGQAQEVHGFIRALLAELDGPEIAEQTAILYGGSVNAENASGLFAQPDVDGVLVGGASLKPKDFLSIYSQA